MLTFSESTTRTRRRCRGGSSSRAMRALAHVPDRPEETVRHTTSSSFASERLNASSKKPGEIWLVVGCSLPWVSLL